MTDAPASLAAPMEATCLYHGRACRSKAQELLNRLRGQFAHFPTPFPLLGLVKESLCSCLGVPDQAPPTRQRGHMETWLLSAMEPTAASAVLWETLVAGPAAHAWRPALLRLQARLDLTPREAVDAADAARATALAAAKAEETRLQAERVERVLARVPHAAMLAPEALVRAYGGADGKGWQQLCENLHAVIRVTPVAEEGDSVVLGGQAVAVTGLVRLDVCALTTDDPTKWSAAEHATAVMTTQAVLQEVQHTLQAFADMLHGAGEGRSRKRRRSPSPLRRSPSPYGRPAPYARAAYEMYGRAAPYARAAPYGHGPRYA